MKSLLIRAVLLGLIIGLIAWLFVPKTAANKTNAETQPIENNNETSNPPAPEPAQKESPEPKPAPKSNNLATDLKSDHAPDQAKLTEYLTGIGSPLAPYAAELAQSEYWALLIGICYIEQYQCTRGPNFNLWGMMKVGGGLRVFSSYPEAIAYMDSYFVRLYPRRSTVQSLRGYYCASACTNWEPTVLRIKALLESSM